MTVRAALSPPRTGDSQGEQRRPNHDGHSAWPFKRRLGWWCGRRFAYLQAGKQLRAVALDHHGALVGLVWCCLRSTVCDMRSEINKSRSPIRRVQGSEGRTSAVLDWWLMAAAL